MPLTEQPVRLRITCYEDGQIQLRRVVRIDRDGVPIAQEIQSVMLEPGQDVANYPKRVRDHAAIEWTPAVVAAYQAAKAAGVP